MPTQTEAANLSTALRYIELLEAFAQPKEFTTILSPNIQHEEFPNLLLKNGSKRDYNAMINGPQQGRKILRENRYEVTNAFASGDWVTLEIVWTGILAIQLGAMAPGHELKAYIATILQFQEGLIVTQHQYDCYEPFPTA